MTTITPILTGVAAHIGTYTDAVTVSGGGTQIFVSGTPGLREDGTPPEDFTDEARQCWANVENALGFAQMPAPAGPPRHRRHRRGPDSIEREEVVA